MRESRAALAGTVIVALLSGSAGVVMAQEGPMAPAMVTGTEACASGVEFDIRPMEGYSLLHASAPFEGHCTVTASDPRVSGPATVGEFWDACYLMGPDDPPFYPSGCIYWGTYRLDGPDGSWEGTWSGVDDEDLGMAIFQLLLEGTDAYEGWSFVANWHAGFTGEPAPWSGLIYEGPLPPWEPPVE